MPTFVSVEPASVCQLRCPECPVGQGKGRKTEGERYILPEVWERVLREAGPYAHTIQFYFQGEPLLNKNLAQMISEAHAMGLYTIVSTNAQAMTEETAEALIRAGLSRITVSMDGLSQESYGAYRIGGDIEQCKNALRWLREAKNKLHGYTLIELQCLRLRTNEHEWDALKACYKKMGADRLTFKTAQLYDYENGNPLMPTDTRYARYQRSRDGHYHRKPLGRGCLRVWSGCVVTTIGEVLPCCYDKVSSHTYGNILQTPLHELFTSQQANAFRCAALKEKPEICKNCGK